jgi:hypothetical protein
MLDIIGVDPSISSAALTAGEQLEDPSPAMTVVSWLRKELSNGSAP